MQFSRLTAPASCAALLLAGCGAGGSASQLAAPPLPAAQSGYAYVTVVPPDSGANGSILGYSVAADGGLTPLADAMVAAGNMPMAVAVDPQGHHAYVVNVGDGSISQFSIGASGSLTPLSPAQIANPGMLTLGAASAAITVDPSGQFVYVTNMADGTVSQFTIGSDGSLAPMTPASIPVGVGPVMIAIDPGSHYAYVANSGFGVPLGAGSVSQFTIAAGGGLVPMNPATISAGVNPRAVTIAPDATYAYVTSNCNGSQCVGEVFQYVIGTGGALSPTGSVMQTGGHYNGIGMLIDSSNDAYLLTNLMGVDTDAGAVWKYSVGADGALQPENPPSLAMTTESVAQSLLGTNLFVLNLDSAQASQIVGSSAGNIERYAIDSDGGLALAATTTISNGLPTSMVVLPAN